MVARWRIPITHGIGLLEVEDQVQFTDVSKVSVQDFHIAMHDFQGEQLVVAGGDGANEEERSVATVDDLRI